MKTAAALAAAVVLAVTAQCDAWLPRDARLKMNRLTWAETAVGGSHEDMRDHLNFENVDTLARVAAQKGHLDIKDIEMCRVIPTYDEDKLLIEAMTCEDDCLMHAVEVDLPDECRSTLESECVAQALQHQLELEEAAEAAAAPPVVDFMSPLFKE
jgi:hypothetical protein